MIKMMGYSLLSSHLMIGCSLLILVQGPDRKESLAPIETCCRTCAISISLMETLHSGILSSQAGPTLKESW
ncbi:uncharacterized protein BCR38DRAFT_416434 [Pseudomassariella vexata]|uniref:Secreted protein n=1 Tax=Pseudomassariella vexata TaxID=1141098 RepID=A0A1Y2EI99_9PEZI|nr:uncharacterized protein BCR38DRAFT_416434 [Pseudomassariella vexata]ORY71311.1 hypothetical protein BCR38DRAFT_416434 [Pseudomassariella vexata]